MSIQRVRAIKAARVLKGMTQKDVAHALGLGETTYVHKENGKLQFTVGQVNQLREILQLTDRELLDIFFNSETESEEVRAAEKKTAYDPTR